MFSINIAKNPNKTKIKTMKDLFLLFSRGWQLISLFYEISDASKTINFQ